MPLISIITPSYNQGRFIRQTIDSVLGQSYKNVEYIVIDGGSTDETVKILKSYGDKIKWISEKDKGQGDAINKGMKIARGEIVAYLNSDDYYLPGTLERVADFFVKNIREKWLSGDYLIVDANGKPMQSFVTFYKNLWKTFPRKNALKITNYVCQPATFWKRDVFEKIGYFDQSYRYVMDYDFWMRLLKNYSLNLVDQKFCAFRIHSTSKGGTQYINQFDEEIVALRRYNTNKLIDLAHVLHNELIKFVYRFLK